MGKLNNIDLNKILFLSYILILMGLPSCNSSKNSNNEIITKCITKSIDLKKCKLYKDEILISEGLYFKGKEINTHTYYDKKGNIISEKEFIFLDTLHNILNQEIFFDKNQDTLMEKSFYFNISKLTDSVILGDSVLIDFRIHIPKNKSSNYKLEIQLDNPENNNEMLVFVANKLNRRIAIKSGTIGKNNIQGIILVGEFLKSDSIEIVDPISVKKFYFDIFYEVH